MLGKDSQNGGAESVAVGAASDPHDVFLGDTMVALPKRTPSPAFQFYPKEFLSSSKVLRMSNTEVGIYIKLLCLSWLDDGLPSDIGKLAHMVGVPVKQFARIWPNVLAECFPDFSNGVLRNPRLERTRKELIDYRKRQAANGSKGGRPPKATGSSGLSKPKPKKRSSSSSASSSSSSSAKKNTESSEPSSEPPLLTFSTVGSDRFWELVPSDVSTWQADFPNVDVFGECRRAHAWIEANPSKRKTARGMRAFLVRWFGRAVDRRSELAPTGTEGRGRTGAPPRGKYDGIEA